MLIDIVCRMLSYAFCIIYICAQYIYILICIIIIIISSILGSITHTNQQGYQAQGTECHRGTALFHLTLHGSHLLREELL